MRALSIIGIILSLGGIPTSIVIMTETHCYCYCNDDYFSSGSTVPDEALGGGFTMLLISVFFLVFSIISTVVSFGKKTPPVVVGGPNYTALSPRIHRIRNPIRNSIIPDRIHTHRIIRTRTISNRRRINIRIRRNRTPISLLLITVHFKIRSRTILIKIHLLRKIHTRIQIHRKIHTHLLLRRHCRQVSRMK